MLNHLLELFVGGHLMIFQSPKTKHNIDIDNKFEPGFKIIWQEEWPFNHLKGVIVSRCFHRDGPIGNFTGQWHPLLHSPLVNSTFPLVPGEVDSGWWEHTGINVRAHRFRRAGVQFKGGKTFAHWSFNQGSLENQSHRSHRPIGHAELRYSRFQYQMQALDCKTGFNLNLLWVGYESCQHVYSVQLEKILGIQGPSDPLLLNVSKEFSRLALLMIGTWLELRKKVVRKCCLIWKLADASCFQLAHGSSRIANQAFQTWDMSRATQSDGHVQIPVHLN